MKPPRDIRLLISEFYAAWLRLDAWCSAEQRPRKTERQFVAECFLEVLRRARNPEAEPPVPAQPTAPAPPFPMAAFRDMQDAGETLSKLAEELDLDAKPLLCFLERPPVAAASRLPEEVSVLLSHIEVRWLAQHSPPLTELEQDCLQAVAILKADSADTAVIAARIAVKVGCDDAPKRELAHLVKLGLLYSHQRNGYWLAPGGRQRVKPLRI